MLYFRKGKNYCTNSKKICAIYTDGAIYKSNVHKLFNRFRSGNFDWEDWERSHQPAVIDTDQIKRQIKNHTGHCRYTPHIALIRTLDYLCNVLHYVTFAVMFKCLTTAITQSKSKIHIKIEGCLPFSKLILLWTKGTFSS